MLNIGLYDSRGTSAMSQGHADYDPAQQIFYFGVGFRPTGFLGAGEGGYLEEKPGTSPNGSAPYTVAPRKVRISISRSQFESIMSEVFRKYSSSLNSSPLPCVAENNSIICNASNFVLARLGIIGEVNVPPNPAIPTILNWSFEVPELVPELAPQGLVYSPQNAGWVFTNRNGAVNSGLQRNGSAFGAENAPHGAQTAFIQGKSAISQTINFEPGRYTLRLWTAKRANSPAQALRVIAPNGAATIINGSSTDFVESLIDLGWTDGGAHELTIEGVNEEGDMFIDGLEITTETGIPHHSLGFRFNGLQAFATKTLTSTALASSSNPATQGASISLTATVSGASPTGTVIFKEGTTTLAGCGAVSLSGTGNTKNAVCTTTALSAGSHSIVAAYSGDAGNSTSTSTALLQVVNAVSGSLVNGGFETPAVGSGYQYNPSGVGLGWTFSVNSGVQGNGSAWGGAFAPEGSQTAFVQGQGSISQSVSLDAGSYLVSFSAAQRACCVSPFSQSLRLRVDGTQVGPTLVPAGTNFEALSVAFSIGQSGSHVLALEGVDSEDRTVFVDNVRIERTASGVPSATISQSQPSTVSGNPYTISWNSSNATTCQITKTLNDVVQFGTSNPWATDLSGNRVVNPAAPGTHVFFMQCSGPGGLSNVSSFVHTVTCPAGKMVSGSGGSTSCVSGSGPSAYINGTSPSAPPGTSFTVNWSSSQATSCTVTKMLDGVWQFPTSNPWATGTSGSKAAAPSVPGTHVFLNNCSGPGGASNTATFTHVVTN